MSDDLRDQIEAAIRGGAYTCSDDNCGLTEAECQREHPITWAGTHTDPATGKTTMWVEGTTDGLADAVMPVVDAAVAAARASCCEDGERTYCEMQQHYERLLAEKDAEIDDKSDVGHAVARAWQERAERAEASRDMWRDAFIRLGGELDRVHLILSEAMTAGRDVTTEELREALDPADKSLLCPRCGKGRPVKAALNEPTLYACGHEDFRADLLAAIDHQEETP